LTGTGIWMGNDGGTYKMHLGNPAGDHMRWDGNELYITGTFVGDSDIGATDSDTFIINADSDDVIAGLTLRRPDRDATLTWDGNEITIDQNIRIPTSRRLYIDGGLKLGDGTTSPANGSIVIDQDVTPSGFVIYGQKILVDIASGTGNNKIDMLNMSFTATGQITNIIGIKLTLSGTAPTGAKTGIWIDNRLTGGYALEIVGGLSKFDDDVDINANLSVNGIGSSLVPTATDTYDLGASTALWRKGWLSELDAVVFAENTITLLGGWFYVCKGQGTVNEDVDGSQTQIDFGDGASSFAVNDFIVFRAAGKLEYMQLVSQASGNVWNVTRDVDGTGADTWPQGTPWANIGYNGDGRIELNAYDSPRISMMLQGTTYNSQTERVRIGELTNWQTAGLTGWGFAIGDYAGGEYIYYTPATGLVIVGDGSGITQIDGGNIQTGTITAAQIAANTITATEIAANTITA